MAAVENTIQKFRFFSEADTNLPVKMEKFDWSKIPYTPLTAQKGDNLAGYEAYTPLNIQVVTHKGTTQFGMGRGKAFDDAKASASGMAALGGKQVGGASGTRPRTKRPQFETKLSNPQAHELLNGAGGVGFKKWFVKGWPILMKNVDLFEDCDTPEKRMGLLNSRNFLRGFVKEKSAKAKKNYPLLAAEPYSFRRKMIENKGRFQSQLWVMQNDNTMIPGRAEDITPHSQVQDFCTFHIIINTEHLELLAISRTAVVSQEAPPPTVDAASIFGGTIVNKPASSAPSVKDDVPMGDASAFSTADTRVEEDVAMMEVGGNKVLVSEAMQLAM